MKRYLLKYNGNWADEMDIPGIYVLDESIYERFKSALDKLKQMEKEKINSINDDTTLLSFSVGSNQEIEYEKFNNIKRDFVIKEISEDEYQVLDKLDIKSIGWADRFCWRVIEKIEDNY